MENKKRLIDANTMRDDWLQNGENEYVYDTNAVLESIDAQPTVDAVEVVHGRWLDGKLNYITLNRGNLIANGVTVQTEDEQRNTYTVQEINELQNEAYDLGVDSALHHHFGLSWDDAAGLRKEIKRLQDAAKWISVKDRLPEFWKDVLVYDSINKETKLAWMGEDCWLGVRMNGKVTHWMPLPEPPKEE